MTKRRMYYEGRTAEGVGMLGELVGYSATPAVIESWSTEKRAEFEMYCERVHLKASDNPVRVPPRPAWLPEPWKGPTRDTGEFSGDLWGAGGTVIEADGLTA